MTSELVDLVRELAPQLDDVVAANRALWTLEDRVRDTDDLREKGEIKIAIDAANLHRHAQVAAFDAEVRRRWPRGADPTSPGAFLSSESIGQMVDRASILALKRTRKDDDGLRRRWSHLLACLERAMAAVRAGTFVHHEVGEPKAYGTR